MNSFAPFRLRLFASPALVTKDGSPLAGRPIQRHRLALLALLARSPESGVSRDILQGHLWPESDSERARNLLNVSVYVLRRALGEHAIVSAGGALRLEQDAVAVDVAAFESAIQRGDREAAVSLYRGPFLDGFFLKDAPEFGRWVERERARLADEYAKTLESLAEEAEAKGDAQQAAHWWKVLTAHDPYASRVALRLMRALAAGGSRAAAVRHAEMHERLLREDLDLEPAPEIRALAEEIRQASAGEGMGGVPALSPLPVAAPTGEITDPAAQDATQTDAVPSARWRRWALLVLVSLIAGAVVVGLVGPRGRDAASDPQRVSVAVLPLTSRGDPSRDAVLADGMTEELIAELARVGVRTVSSTSVFALRDQRSDVRGVARRLGVSHVLEGDWQTVGHELRVRLRLVDGEDGSVLWSRTYRGELGDVFSLQEDIARAVVRELDVPPREPGGPARLRPPTNSPTAWELYLRASQPEVLRSDSAAREALTLFSRAVELDPTFAAAHAGLARLHLRIGPPENPDMPRAERLVMAKGIAMKATELDASLAEGHATLGIAEMHLYDFVAAETHLRQALELDPSRSRTREWLVTLYIWEGRFEEALEQARRALDDDPLSPSARAEVARALLVNGRCEEALTQLATLADLVPPLLRAGPIAAQCHARDRRWDEAVSDVQGGLDRAGAHGQAMLGYFLARSGRRSEAVVVLSELLESWRQAGGDAFWIALVYAGLGQHEEALDWLERSIDDYSLTYEVREPMFADVQGDPRFESLLARVGLRSR